MSEEIIANAQTRGLVPGFGGRISAALVWDGGEVSVPKAMGEARPDQMIGVARERLVETCGRVCYDSLGKGRSSVDFHDHLRSVHRSPHEAAAFTVEFVMQGYDDMMATRDSVLNGIELVSLFQNRPSVWTRRVKDGQGYRVRATLNLRHVLEWEAASKKACPDRLEEAGNLGTLLIHVARDLAPGIIPDSRGADWVEDAARGLGVEAAHVDEPETDEEKWISLYVVGSRGFSHELVRHGDWTAISQRCLAGDTEIKFTDSKGVSAKKRGFWTLADLFAKRQDPRLWAVVKKRRVRVYDEDGKGFTFGKMLDVVSSGVKPCFRVVLQNGKSVTCTKDHRILTDSGWKTLDEIVRPILTVGGLVSWDKAAEDRVACNGLAVAGLGLYRDEAWLREQVLVLKKTQPEIAEASQCSAFVVRKYIRKFGIQAKQGGRPGGTPWNKGKTYTHTKRYSPETIEKYRQSKLGPKNPGWKGGKGTEARRAFQAWARTHKREIFERDGWACRLCGKHSSQVEPNGKHFRKRAIELHHILPLWNRPDLACDPGNLATVCWRCQLVVNNRELEFAPRLLEAIKSPVRYEPSDRQRKVHRRRVVPHFSRIERIEWAGEIPTFDLVLEGPNHGFVGNGIVVRNSTRFVDESESEWVLHPLLGQAWADAPKRGGLATNIFTAARSFADQLMGIAHGLGARPQNSSKKIMDDLVEEIRDYASFWEPGPLGAGMAAQEQRVLYAAVVRELQMALEAKGVDKTTARKQARGASRGFLGNALETELVFSGSVAQWRNVMIPQRAADAADAEIRLGFTEAVLPCLRASRYGDRFAHLELVAASDGIGRSLRGGGHK